MFKFTGKELKTKEASIAALFNAKLDVYAMFKMRKFTADTVDAFKAIETRRQELVKLHGVDDGKGTFDVPPEKMDAFAKDIEAELEKEFELAPVTLKIRDFEKAGLTVGDIMNLDFLLDQEDDSPHTKLIELPGAASKAR